MDIGFSHFFFMDHMQELGDTLERNIGRKVKNNPFLLPLSEPFDQGGHIVTSLFKPFNIVDKYNDGLYLIPSDELQRICIVRPILTQSLIVGVVNSPDILIRALDDIHF